MPTLTFSRASVAYHPETGTIVFANQPRYAKGVYGQALLVEEGTTNLLTADQSSFEGGTSGWVLLGGSARDSTRAWHGSYSVKLTRTVSSGYQGLLDTGVANARPASPGTAYAASAWVWPTGLTGTWTFRVEAINASGATISRYGKNGWTAGVADEGAAGGRWFLPTSPGGAWQRFVVPIAPTPANTAKLQIWIFNDSGGAGDYGWIDAIQLEQKPYATSFVPGGTTRSAETLFFPTAGVLGPGNGNAWDRGCVALWAYLRQEEMVGGASPRFMTFFRAQGGSAPLFDFYHLPSAPEFFARLNNVQFGWTPPSPLATGWHHFALVWDRNGLGKFFVDGVLRSSANLNGVTLPILSSATLGGDGITGWLNAPLDDVRIYSRALSDAEIAALAGASSAPGTNGETLAAPLNGNLAYYPEPLAVGLTGVSPLRGSLLGIARASAPLEAMGSLAGSSLLGIWGLKGGLGAQPALWASLLGIHNLEPSLFGLGNLNSGIVGIQHLTAPLGSVAGMGGALVGIGRAGRASVSSKAAGIRISSRAPAVRLSAGGEGDG